MHYHHHYDHVDKGWSEAGIGWLASGPKMREVCLPHHKKQRSAFPSHLMSYRETMERGPCQRVSLDSQSIPLYGLVRQAHISWAAHRIDWGGELEDTVWRMGPTRIGFHTRCSQAPAREAMEY